MEKLMQLIFTLPLFFLPFAFVGHEYSEALPKSIMFFEAYRSDYLHHKQRVLQNLDCFSIQKLDFRN